MDSDQSVFQRTLYCILPTQQLVKCTLCQRTLGFRVRVRRRGSDLDAQKQNCDGLRPEAWRNPFSIIYEKKMTKKQVSESKKQISGGGVPEGLVVGRWTGNDTVYFGLFQVQRRTATANMCRRWNWSLDRKKTNCPVWTLVLMSTLCFFSLRNTSPQAKRGCAVPAGTTPTATHTANLQLPRYFDCWTVYTVVKPCDCNHVHVVPGSSGSRYE